MKALHKELTQFSAAMTLRQPPDQSKTIHRLFYGVLREKQFYLSSVADAWLREENRRCRKRPPSIQFKGRKKPLSTRPKARKRRELSRLSRMMWSPLVADDLLHLDYMVFMRELLRSDSQLVVSIDESDLQKRCSHQPGVKFNRKRSDKSPGRGWQLMAAAAHLSGGVVVPLYAQVYSDGKDQTHATKKEDKYLGLQDERKQAIRSLLSHVPENTVVVADRGFDVYEMIEYMGTTNLDFIFGVRTDGRSRYYDLPEKKACRSRDVINSMTSWRRFTARVKNKEVTAKIGFRSGIRPRPSKDRPSSEPSEKTYSMVVVDDANSGERLFVMLTSRDVRTFGDARRVYNMYSRRSGIEQCFRFMKRGKLQCEKQMLLHDWVATRRQMRMIFYVAGFLAWLGVMRPRVADFIMGFKIHLNEEPNNIAGRIWETIDQALMVLNRMPRGP